MHRSCGILLHPTSLPSPNGIGDLGREARRFVDWLVEGGQSLWQVLPLGPTGYGDSPYASFSTFAGNSLLVALEPLVEEGWLSRSETTAFHSLRPDRVDYGLVIPWKNRLLNLAAERMLDSGGRSEGFERFVREETFWLDDYALFMDLKEHFDLKARAEGKEGAMWSNYWPRAYALRESEALRSWSEDHARGIRVRKAVQYFFFSQWRKLKNYANRRGVRIIGDLPIFVASDSVDVWAHRELFLLDDSGAPREVAGVPPDYFSATGQLWGNPLYDWDRHASTGFRWWIDRIKGNLRLFDWLRIDHFRGFESFWAVPSGDATAVGGSWKTAPGAPLFTSLRKELGELPILAEDLGFITPAVRSLRDSFGLPGMKILQFAFDAKESGRGLDTRNGFLPHMYGRNCVVYTGTHDNDTLAGWLAKASDEELAFIRDYLGGENGEGLLRQLIRLAYASVADFCVIPLQDVLGLDSSARMNTPSTIGGNWAWRLGPGVGTFKPEARWLSELAKLYARDTGEEGSQQEEKSSQQERESRIQNPEEVTRVRNRFVQSRCTASITELLDSGF